SFFKNEFRIVFPASAYDKGFRIFAESTAINGKKMIELYPFRFPVKGKIDVGIRVGPECGDKGVMLVAVNGNDEKCAGVKFKDGFVWGSTFFGGKYTYDIDKEPPSIVLQIRDGAILHSLKRLLAKIEDIGSGIGPQAEINLYVDDKWFPAEYDPESAILKYEFEHQLEKGEHTITVEATDNVGNKRVERRKVVLVGE
ncbi:MAG: hypothetical protein ACPL6C_04710, partial [bacterium]